MYKQVFQRLWKLLINPAQAWKTIQSEPIEPRLHLSGFFYPLVGLAALMAFLHPFLIGDEIFKEMLSDGIRKGLLVFVSTVFGLLLSARILDAVYARWFGWTGQLRKAEVLAAYALAPVLAVNVLTELMTELFFLKIIYLYIFVIIWEASTHFYAVLPEQQGKFTALSGGVVLIVPIILEKWIKLFLPGL